jgi:hypothetical protein
MGPLLQKRLESMYKQPSCSGNSELSDRLKEVPAVHAEPESDEVQYPLKHPNKIWPRYGISQIVYYFSNDSQILIRCTICHIISKKTFK